MCRTLKINLKPIFLFAASLVLALLPFQAFSADAPAADEARPLLGPITLGKTTIKEFADAVKARGCSVTSTSQKATVGAGCFKLPGNPQVVAENMTKGENIITVVVVTFQRNTTSEAYDSYLRALMQTYGEPTESRNNPLAGRQTAIWKTPNVDVFIHEANSDSMATLLYATPEVFESALKAEIAKKGHIYDLDKL